MESRRDVFQAIADPTRRAIISMIALQPMTPGAIAANFDTARQTISRHIQILVECELLQQQFAGREIYYQLDAGKMKSIADFIEPFKAMWESRYTQLDNVLKTMKPKK